VPLPDVSWLCFAQAGVWREADRRAVGAVLEQCGVLDRATLMSDVEAVIAAAECDGPALAVIAGTGSVVVGRDAAGRLHKVGGSGHLLDDNGSAYDLGISGLRAALEAADGRGPQTTLTQTLLDAAGLRSVDDVVPWLYRLDKPKSPVAGLAPVVVEAAQEGDAVAGAILDRAASDLTRWVTVAAQAIGASAEALSVVPAGGLLENSEPYRRLVETRIKLALPDARLVRPEHEAAYGAALIALRDWQAKASRE